MTFVQTIIEGLFGVDAGLSGELSAQPRCSLFDPEAELRSLSYQGKTYSVSSAGVREEV